ncbi:MAG: hypothetical protein M3068_12270 [Gemmatimonadota bacterium]|nr:hypothetical protein [Gemmatimonadota bacterium]
MYDLSEFSLSDMTLCGRELRRLGYGARSMEEIAQRIVRYFRENFRAGTTADPECALVRFFLTVPYRELEPELQRFAQTLVGGERIAPEMRCLTLLATAGEEPAWNSRQSSAGHRALPLLSEESIARSPMIAQLMGQFGIELATLLEPDPAVIVDEEQHSYNVFHIPEAAGSPFIPAQREFVQKFGIRSVLGFGGLLPSAELFAVILFSRRGIPRQTADLFKTLALNVKVALLPLLGGRRFA